MLRQSVSGPMPVWPNLPSPSVFFPLVFCVAALIPALSVWLYGGLTRAQATWGMVALHSPAAGVEAGIIEQGNPPPLFTWSLFLTLQIPLVDKLVLLPLASYLYGLGTLALVYFFCCSLHSSGPGLLAVLLLAFNPAFLADLQSGQPSTAIAFFTISSLYCYWRHSQSNAEVFSRWVGLGALSFAGLLLSSGLFALWMPVIALLDYLVRNLRDNEVAETLQESSTAPTVIGGLLVIGAGFVMAAPWLMRAPWHWGPLAPWQIPPSALEVEVYSISTLFHRMPATIILALFAMWRTIREALRGNEDVPLVPMPLIWALVSVFALESGYASREYLLFAIIPMTILAVQTLVGVLQREYDDRQIFILMVATVATFVAMQQSAITMLPQWVWQGRPRLTGQQKFEIHLGIDMLVGMCVLVTWLYVMSATSDRLRRRLWGGFVITAIGLSCLAGWFHQPLAARGDDPWERIFVWMQQKRDLDVIVFLGTNPPEPQLQFVVECVYPRVPTLHVDTPRQLEALLQREGDRPLILLTDSGQRMGRTKPLSIGDRTMTISQVYDSDQLVAYAPIAESATIPVKSPSSKKQ